MTEVFVGQVENNVGQNAVAVRPGFTRKAGAKSNGERMSFDCMRRNMMVFVDVSDGYTKLP
ncbi:hypothetical protein Daus18300_005735 [Diaporthe australafricana]|uniref:Uncharacterized protein n=1 Tax=Diaporthe australafricana TaxID=127596 RepID=A0ABR3WYY2_9PEZI